MACMLPKLVSFFPLLPVAPWDPHLPFNMKVNPLADFKQNKIKINEKPKYNPWWKLESIRLCPTLPPLLAL